MAMHGASTNSSAGTAHAFEIHIVVSPVPTGGSRPVHAGGGIRTGLRGESSQGCAGPASSIWMKGASVKHIREGWLEEARIAILEAMLAPTGWDAALDAFAHACGGSNGQLIVRDGEGQAMLHCLTGVPEDFTQVAESLGLADAVGNPRLRAGLDAPLMAPRADQDYVDTRTRARLPIYGELFDPYDLFHNCQVVLMREPGILVRASVTRTRRQGVFDSQALHAFTTLAPYLRLAVQARAMLGLSQAQSALRTLDAVDATAFVLDARGRVMEASSRGGEALSNGEHVRMVAGRLQACDPVANDKLAMKLPCLLSGEMPVFSLVLGDAVLDARPLPLDRDGLGFGPAAIAVLRAPGDTTERMAMLSSRHGLTLAESEVALALANGSSLAAIARDRGVSLPTVRSQLQSVFSKLGVSRQAELVARLRGC